MDLNESTQRGFTVQDMIKKLKISDPFVNYSLSIDNIISVAQANGPGLEYMIYENFINVAFDDFFYQRQFINFSCYINWRSYANGLFPMIIPREYYLSKGISPSKQFIDMIDNDYYVYTLVDTFYVKGYSNSFQTHRRHDLFIYGYNLEEKIFYTRAYFDYQTAEYKEIPFSEVDTAIKLYDDTIIARDYLGATGFKVMDFGRRDVNVLNIYKELIEFVSTNKMYAMSSEYKALSPDKKAWGATRLHGISFFEFIMAELETNRYEKLNTRSFHFISVHIKLMMERMKYLSDKYKFEGLTEEAEKLNELLKTAEIIRNMALKESVVFETKKIHDAEFLKAIRDYISTIYDKYSESIYRFIDIIEDKKTAK